MQILQKNLSRLKERLTLLAIVRKLDQWHIIMQIMLHLYPENIGFFLIKYIFAACESVVTPMRSSFPICS